MSASERPTVFIHAAFRSPIGKFGGSLAKLSAPQIGAEILRMAVAKTGLSHPDFVIAGHARQAGSGPNTARQALIYAGLSEVTPAWTINHACASGMSAVILGAEKILLGRATKLWVGGFESMSKTPYLLPAARWGQKLGHSPLVDAMYQDGFHCPMAKMLMGETVEQFIAKDRKISRNEQDEFALQSHVRAVKAATNGDFRDEILALDVPGVTLKEDEVPRPDTSLEALGKLAPSFDPHGTLSPGNSSAIVDGAAWLALSHQREGSLAQIIDYDVSALDPKLMGLGPVLSIRKLLKRNSLEINDVNCFEINEAFAAQVLACQRDLEIPNEKLNSRGGAIALGHPIGASGARILVTLCHQLKKNPGALGIASLCVSGGQGVSILIKSL